MEQKAVKQPMETTMVLSGLWLYNCKIIGNKNPVKIQSGRHVPLNIQVYKPICS